MPSSTGDGRVDRCVRAGLDAVARRLDRARVARNEFKRQVAAGGQGVAADARDRPPVSTPPAGLAESLRVVSGRLLVVGTPIGNLGDLSPRGAEALRGADLVVAEDTRVAARLLRHLGTRRPTVSFTEHNAAERLPGLLARLAAGETLALTTDAGMPAISDPGARLVAAARDAGHAVEVVPGPSAVTAALAVAGLSGGGFVFGGFLPTRPGFRAAGCPRAAHARPQGPLACRWCSTRRPHRVQALLRDLDGLTGAHPDLRVAAARELTKIHEEVVVGGPERTWRRALRAASGRIHGRDLGDCRRRRAARRSTFLRS